MQRYNLLATLMLVGLLALGCEKKDESAPAGPGGTTAGEKLPGRDSVAGAADQAKDAAAGAVDTAKAAGASAVEEATKMVEQVKTYINEKNFAQAEAVLAKLDGMKATLPESVQKMIADTRSMLDKAKAVLPK